MPLKRIPHSKLGALNSRPRWAAHTRIGNVWKYPPWDCWFAHDVTAAMLVVKNKSISLLWELNSIFM